MKQFTIEDPIYGQTVHVVLNCSGKEFTKVVKKKLKINIDGDIKGDDGGSYFNFKDNKDNESCYIWLEKFTRSTECLGLLVHELYHHVAYALKHVNVKNEEATAYYLQYLMSKALEELA